MQEFHCARCMKKIGEGMVFCPYCGYDQRTPQAENALRRFTVLHGRYVVGDMIGKGGFGLTYVGMDLTLEMKVAIKEYYPSGTASRLHSYSNNVRWDTSDADWNREREKNINRFLREARRMARLDDVPGVVRVRDTFRENETAYIVMDFVEGDTLKKWLLAHGPMSWDMCRNLLMPIVDSLAVIHDNGFIHRDIAPDNIMVRPNGTARLLDLGAAVDTSANNGQASMVVVKNNFSAPEQYDQQAVLGSWTDVYSMSTTIYYCLTGKLMPSAIDRIMHSQTIEFPPERNVPENVAEALLAGMDMEPEHRIHDMRELKRRLLGSADQAAGAADETIAEGVEQTESWSDRVRRWADIQKEREASAGASQSQGGGPSSWQPGTSAGGSGMSGSQAGGAQNTGSNGGNAGETMPWGQPGVSGTGGGNAGETMPWGQPGVGGPVEKDVSETMPWNQQSVSGTGGGNAGGGPQWEQPGAGGTVEKDTGETMPWNQQNAGTTGGKVGSNAPGSQQNTETTAAASDEKNRKKKERREMWMEAFVITSMLAYGLSGFLRELCNYSVSTPTLTFAVLGAVVGTMCIYCREKAMNTPESMRTGKESRVFNIAMCVSICCIGAEFILYLYYYSGMDYVALSTLILGSCYLTIRNRKKKEGKTGGSAQMWIGILTVICSLYEYGVYCCVSLWILQNMEMDMLWILICPILFVVSGLLLLVLKKESKLKIRCRRVFQTMILANVVMILGLIWGTILYT